MSTRYYTLDRATGLWVRYGRPAIPAIGGNDGFVVGVTPPTTLNAGAVTGSSRVIYTGSTDIHGSNDPEAPLALHSFIFTRPVRVLSGYVWFWDCEFTNLDGVVPSSETALLYAMAADVKGVLVERSTFDPGVDGAHWFLDAIEGHHITVRRNVARRVVDFVGSFNIHSTVTDTVVEGNLLESLAYFYNPTPGIVHPSDTRTHNDGLQHQGGQGIVVRGNWFNGIRRHPDGSLPTDQGTDWEQYADNGVLLQGSVQKGIPISTPEYPAIISNNWIFGFNQVFPIKTARGGTDGAGAYDATLLGNRLDDRRRYQGPSPVDYYGVPGGRPYVVRTGTETTVNGDTSVPADGVERVLSSGDNRYFADSRTSAVARRGQLITIRRDAFAGDQPQGGN